MSYHKVQKGQPMYDTIRKLQRSGMWVCDAKTHNSRKGCSNPECFKYRRQGVKG